MRLSLLLAIHAIDFALAQTTTLSGVAMNTTAMTMPATTAMNSSSALEYSITALPAVQSQPACVFNCLIPIGLADPSGCDDVTNDCACLSAPADVLTVLAGCIQTVCQSSTSVYAAAATSLYQSYCQSIYGAAAISSALSAESVAATATSTASASSSSAPNSSASPSAGSTATPSTTTKSGSAQWSPPFFTVSICTIAGLIFLASI